jgi:preprotein translocase subunit SecG
VVVTGTEVWIGVVVEVVTGCVEVVVVVLLQPAKANNTTANTIEPRENSDFFIKPSFYYLNFI